MPKLLERCAFPLQKAALFLSALCILSSTQGSHAGGPGAVYVYINGESGPSGEGAQAEETLVKKPAVHPEVPRIPAEEVKDMLAEKADFVIVDTNPADFFELWHIPTAVNIPYVILMDSPDRLDSMLAVIPRNKKIVLYCLCEEGADSSEVALMLRRMGYRRDRVLVLEGGLIQWDAKGYPMVKKEMPE